MIMGYHRVEKPVCHLSVARRFDNFVDHLFCFDDVIGIVEEREASQKDEELPALARLYWFLFLDTSHAAVPAKWNAMSYPQRDRIARRTASFAMFFLVSVAAYLEYLFDLNSYWFAILSFVASFACLYPLVRWQEKQRRVRAS